MENRFVTRHNTEQLSDAMFAVLVILPDKSEVESRLVDISSQGLKLSIPPQPVPLAIPRKAETVDVVFQTSSFRLTCRCIYSAYNPDGSIYLGMHVFDPHQQNQLRGLLGEVV
ncbi:PilZ domain-containing protein [Geobacter sp. AOG2]|uniref:PilZ domain-containing protein n=1 Tax=Geobacter sp. AOG2 TaxID=1566347 RepID=UPI001CC72F20|nr:PilZ domain-containing protein [Geobacter sp. AOG2]GFE62422.1 hypothetical protein AOG2_30100 [Geobacter sp. AOG2]